MSRTASPTLADRLAALCEALEVADGRLPATDLAATRALLAKAGAREALGDATVVALAGATGSGKSTLFNALSGAEISTPGVRRPTTGVAHATTWGQSQDRLLDWLQVPRRHVRTDGDPALSGLVLLDLPDHDSTHAEHRLEVDRLAELVDLLVWVLDPQKYADAAVHERYLAPRAGHAGVLLVLLNQVDLLDAAAERACMNDLRALLDSEGLAATPLLPVSARTGTGLNLLSATLAERVRARQAATERLTADVRTVAGELSALCSTTVPGRPETSAPARQGPGEGGGARHGASPADLTDALADAAGVPVVVRAVEQSSIRQGVAATGWPPLRVARRLRRDPLKRLRVGDAAVRTNLPAAGPGQRAAMAGAVRDARESAGEGLSQVWRDELRRTAETTHEQLPEQLDRAIAGAGAEAVTVPWWQRAVGGLQTLLLVVALVGALWLLASAGLSFLQLDGVLPEPRLGRLPLPTALLVLALLAGALLALVVRPFVRARARRQGKRVRKRLAAAIEQVAQEQVLAPLAAARADHDRFCAAVTRAAT